MRVAMHPFLAAELGDAFDLDQALGLGLVPGVLGAADPQAALQAYLGLYVREEVKAEGLLHNLAAFGRFLGPGPRSTSCSTVATLSSRSRSSMAPR